MYVLDGLALYFKRFLLAGRLHRDGDVGGIRPTASKPVSAEFYALILFALAGMLFACSANDFALLFVSLELITVTFYVLTSFPTGTFGVLEAGVKYLVIGALSTGFTVFGIALVYGISRKLNLGNCRLWPHITARTLIFLFGLMLVMAGLGFKIAAFPFQFWRRMFIKAAPCR